MNKDKCIKNMFNNEMTEMQGLNNIKVAQIVFSNNSIKANSKMEEILEQHKSVACDCIAVRNEDGIKEIRYEDGTRCISVKPNDNCKGYRCNHAFIDRDLSLEDVQNYILSVAFYCSKDTVEMF